MGEWEALRERCLQCRACALCETRTQVVFGVGDSNAEVLFVGEAPDCVGPISADKTPGLGGESPQDSAHRLALGLPGM